MRPLLLFTLFIFITGCASQPNQNTTVKDSTVTTVTVAVPVLPNDTTYQYEPTITTIDGIICKMAVYRLDHEEDTLPLDTVIAVAFPKPITVINPPGTDTSKEDTPEIEYGVDTVQLVMPSYHSADKFVGRVARLTGTFYHADNGNQKTPVLLTVQQIAAGSDTVRLKP